MTCTHWGLSAMSLLRDNVSFFLYSDTPVIKNLKNPVRNLNGKSDPRDNKIAALFQEPRETLFPIVDYREESRPHASTRVALRIVRGIIDVSSI